MTQDLAHKRPWLLASLAFGLSYPFVTSQPWPEFYIILWKMAGLSFLVPYALRRHHNGDFAILALSLAFCALGDGLIEFDLRAGAASFIMAHLTAIFLYWRHLRVHPVPVQKIIAVLLFAIPPVLAYFLPGQGGDGRMTAFYTLFLSAMAAMAWSSNFPRYRVGIGAILFIISDLLIFARLGPLSAATWVGPTIWYSYYAAMVLIATGIVQTLVKRGHYQDGESPPS